MLGPNTRHGGNGIGDPLLPCAHVIPFAGAEAGAGLSIGCASIGGSTQQTNSTAKLIRHATASVTKR